MSCSKCSVCRTRVGLLGFECKFCKNNLCVHHRLPEDHDCSQMELAKNKHKEINRKKLESESLKENKLVFKL
jgi:predicted nucleic acid binding AN1-type Zn finger protein